MLRERCIVGVHTDEHGSQWGEILTVRLTQTTMQDIRVPNGVGIHCVVYYHSAKLKEQMYVHVHTHVYVHVHVCADKKPTNN